MTPEDAPSFARLLAGLGEVFNEPVSEIRARGYFEALKDFDLATVERAVSQVIMANKFFPKPVEIREAIEGSPDDKAATAWGRLMYAVEWVGTYQSVTFQDPVLHAVVDVMGGWSEMWQLGRLELDDLGYRESEFRRLYTVLSRRLPYQPPAHLPGRHELDNGKNTWAIRPPVVIPGLPEIQRLRGQEGPRAGDRFLPPAPLLTPPRELQP